MIERWFPLDRHGYPVTVLLWVAFITGIWFLWLFIAASDTMPFVSDFAIFHSAANAVATGALSPAEIYDANILAKHTLTMHGEKAIPLGSPPYLYPPTVLGVMVPLGLLDVVAAHILWGGIVIACMGLSAWLLGARGILLAALAINPLTLFISALGHPEMFPVLALSLGLYLSSVRPTWAGVALSFMTLKPQLALAGIILMVMRRNYRMLVGYIAGSAVLFLFTSALFGVQSWVSFGESVFQFSKTLGFDMNLRLDSMLTGFAAAKYFGASDQVAKLFHASSMVVAIGIVLLRPTIAVIVIASLMLPIYNNSTGYTMLLVPTIIMLHDYPRSFQAMVFLACYAFLTVGIHFGGMSTLSQLKEYPPVGAFTLWALLVIAAVKDPAQDRAGNYS